MATDDQMGSTSMSRIYFILFILTMIPVVFLGLRGQKLSDRRAGEDDLPTSNFLKSLFLKTGESPPKDFRPAGLCRGGVTPPDPPRGPAVSPRGLAVGSPDGKHWSVRIKYIK
eukprot:1136361-Prorocentrum_minimum.AAC.1